MLFTSFLPFCLQRCPGTGGLFVFGFRGIPVGRRLARLRGEGITD
jgi:hypothetical protein